MAKLFRRRRNVSLLSCLALPFVIACGAPATSSPAAGDEQPHAGEQPHAIGAAHQELNSAEVERVAPIRFVSLSPAPAAVRATNAQVQSSIDGANRAFRPTGLQFTLGHNDAALMPTIAANVAYNNEVQLCWGTCGSGTCTGSVSAEFASALGVAPSAVAACEQHNARDWLKKMAALYAPTGEILVWVGDAIGPNSGGPDSRRDVMISSGSLQQGTYSELAHELGHYFGLGHANELWTDVRTGQPETKGDFWDLYYLPGCGASDGAGCPQAHRFFTSRADFDLHAGDVNPLGQGVQPIERCVQQDTCDAIKQGQSCLVNEASGEITCLVGVCKTWDSANHICGSTSYVEKFTSSDPKALLGRSLFPAKGANLMTYTNLTIPNVPDSLTETQVLQVRNALRYDIPLSIPSLGVSGVTGGRPLLGDSRALTPLAKLDVDGDGKRDLVYYTPTTSTFKVALSTQSFSSAAVLTLPFAIGAAGGIPFAGDIDGDGFTDLGVYSGGQARYCLTNGANPLGTTCASPASIPAGTAGAKLVGVHRMSASSTAGSIVFFKDGWWTWRDSANHNYAAPVGNLGDTAYWAGAMAMAGSYDGDDVDDLVVFRPQTASFVALLSTTAYQTPITTSFSTAYVGNGHASANGNSYLRSGAVPVPNMTWRSGTGSTHLALALWQPETAAWEVHYNPYGTPQVVSGALYGAPGDVPVGGLDLSAGAAGTYSFSSLSVYRSGALALQSSLTYGNGYVFREFVGSVSSSNAAPLPAPGVYSISNLGAASTRKPVFSVSDMTGDGLADVIELDPDAGLVRIFRSPGLTVATPVYVGAVNDELLLAPVAAQRGPRDPRRAFHDNRPAAPRRTQALMNRVAALPDHGCGRPHRRLGVDAAERAHAHLVGRRTRRVRRTHHRVARAVRRPRHGANHRSERSVRREAPHELVRDLTRPARARSSRSGGRRPAAPGRAPRRAAAPAARRATGNDGCGDQQATEQHGRGPHLMILSRTPAAPYPDGISPEAPNCGYLTGRRTCFWRTPCTPFP